MTAAQLSQLTYQGVAGSVDTLQVRVNDGTVWSNWTSFTVTPTLVIEAAGSTSLVQVGNDYFFNPVAGGTGPELKYSGAPRLSRVSLAPGRRSARSRRQPVTKLPGRYRGRSVYGLEYRQQRQLRLYCNWCGVGKQHRAGDGGDQLPPGPERRRRNRASTATSSDGDRVVRCHQPGPGR